jgi:hypothetical protein
MKPTIGRTVIYNHPGSADGTFKPAQSPMVIQAVNEDGSVKGWVLGENVLAFRPRVEQGDGPCQWNWPPRV